MCCRSLARILSLALVTCAALPGAARADDGHFGHAGQWFLAGGSAVSLGFVRDTLDDTAATEWYLALNPSAGYFFASRGFVALDLTGSYAAESGATVGTVGLGPAVGLRLPIGPLAHFAPSVGLLYTHQRVANSSNIGFSQLVLEPSATTASNVLAVKVAAPFLIELRPGLGITLGPSFLQDVVARSDGGEMQKITRVTIDFGLAGWIS